LPEQEGTQPQPGLDGHIIICGYGRVGQGVARMLDRLEYPYLALDNDPLRVATAQQAGERVRYGDAAQRPVLEAAALGQARALVVTFLDTNAVLRLLEQVRNARPDLPVLVRTADDTALDSLIEAGASEAVAETLESSLTLAAHLLLQLGAGTDRVLEAMRDLRRDRYRRLRGYYPDRLPVPGELHPGYAHYLHTVTLPRGARLVGRTLQQANLPRWGVVVHALRRNGSRDPEPDAGTVLQEGDVLVLSGPKLALRRAEKYLLRRALRRDDAGSGDPRGGRYC
jgi:CPA2 family monovalent cation:H+ antiporter-2